MKYKLSILLLLFVVVAFAQTPDAATILAKIDKNMASDNRIMTSQMVINGVRGSRTIESKSWSVGEKDAYTEYLAPAREKGTKMLKTNDQLWIYSPTTDRTVQISGHMLRQSVMGSDLSYEDMMNSQKLTEKYTATVTGSEVYNNTDCFVIELIGKADDLAYPKQKMWVHKQYFVPVKQEMYAKSGKLLKQTELSDIRNLSGRWFPMKIVFKDMLKTGKGTEFIILEIATNQKMPDGIFTKAMLKK